MRVLTFGEILLRLGAPGYTKLFQKDSFDVSFCGGEANVAVSLAVLGLESSFLTRAPNDDVGRAAINSLRYFGVDTSKVCFDNGRLGLYYLEKGASQRPSKIIYDRTNSLIAQSQVSDFDWDTIFDGIDWFHWTGINPALSESMVEVSLEACKIAKAKGITVSCDLNYRGKLWTPEQARAVMPQLMPYVDVCIANEEDADKCLGLKSSGTDTGKGILERAGYIRTAEMIHSLYGCSYIATTLRKSISASVNGWSAMLYDARALETYYSDEYIIQLVDRVGGGDSFAAGLIYGMATGMEPQETIDFATAASCLKQTIEGDYNRTTVDDVKQLLNNGGNGRVQR